jgi:hypothetical protein
MRRSAVALALAVALVLTLAAAASGRTDAGGVTPTVFSDPTGDNGTAADIKTVTVTNDASGFYTFDTAFATALTPTSFFDLYLDSDLNGSTGDPQSAGADYVVDVNLADKAFGFYKWDGTQFSFVQTSTVKVAINPNNLELSIGIGSADLGTTKGVNFWVESSDPDGSAGHYDDAPNGSSVWQYMLQQPLTLSVVAAQASAAKSGHAWALVMAVRRSDTGNYVSGEGTIACKASSGSTKLAVVQRAFISSGGGGASAAVCGFSVPKKLKGKLVTGTITVTVQGVTVAKTFTKRVS